MDVNKQFYETYPNDLPQSMSFWDYLNPKRYIDPYNTYSNPFKRTPQVKETGSTQPNVSVPQSAEADKGFKMSNLTDYIPNVFASSTPTSYDNLLQLGLITPEQVAKQQKAANIQGLLGAGLALAQGMSKIGPRRSAAENILGALAGGFGASAGAYQQGMQNIVQQQQLAQSQIAVQQAAQQRQAIDNLLKSPEVANDPVLVAYIRANPNEALKMLSEQMPLKKAIAGGQTPAPTVPQAAPQAAPQAKLEASMAVDAQGQPFFGVPNYSAGERYADEGMHQQVLTLPPVRVDAQYGPDFLLQQDKDRLIKENRAIAGLTDKASLERRRENINQIAAIDKQLDRFAVGGYDFDAVKNSIPEKFKPQIDAIKKLAETGALPAEQVRIAVQEIYKQSQESERGMRIEGIVGTYALAKYGTLDQSKLTPDQLADVIRFQNAPDADKLAQLQRENLRTQLETGRSYQIPTGRSEFVNTVAAQTVTPKPVTTQQVTPQTTTTQPVTTQPVVVEPVVQQTTTAKPVSTLKNQIAPENAPPETKALYSYNKDALINQPDFKYPPKKKMELREKQAPLQSAVTYSLTSIKDARDAAQSLKNNPQYIDALTGRFSPLLSGTVGGVVISQDAKTANALLENILTRTFVGEIQAMRDASPTGGAVGSVTEKEMDALSKIRAALSIGMDKNEFIKQLDNYLSIANRSIKNIPTEYAKTFGYNGEFDEILTTPGVSTAPTSGKTPVQLELERRKKGKQ